MPVCSLFGAGIGSLIGHSMDENNNWESDHTLEGCAIGASIGLAIDLTIIGLAYYHHNIAPLTLDLNAIITNETMYRIGETKENILQALQYVKEYSV